MLLNINLPGVHHARYEVTLTAPGSSHEDFLRKIGAKLTYSNQYVETQFEVL